VKNREELITNIESDVVFQGKFHFEDQLIVKGKLEGEVSGREGRIVIEKEGSINGDVVAGTVDNYGLLQGKAQMDEYNLYAHGASDAEISVKTVMIEKQAKFNGKCIME
jgi:cytoskeletal protein CcmA (bactofilin family)